MCAGKPVLEPLYVTSCILRGRFHDDYGAFTPEFVKQVQQYVSKCSGGKLFSNWRVTPIFETSQRYKMAYERMLVILWFFFENILLVVPNYLVL